MQISNHDRRTIHAITVALSGLFLVSCGSEPSDSTESNGSDMNDGSSAPAWFADEASTRGIDFEWVSGHADLPRLPEIVGGGAALFDMDGDGDLDAYLVQAGSMDAPRDQREPNILLQNDGSGNFTRVTECGDAGDRGYGMGVACGDYDNDGDTDLYVTNLGPNVMLRNDGGGVFTDVTGTAGVGHPGFGTSATFFDADGDDDLDLFFVNYVNWTPETELPCYNGRGKRDYCAPVNYNAPSMDVLYRNNGDGTFTDVSIDAGLDAFFGNGLGVAAADFTADGWPDLFVANDGNADQLWVNQGDGTFIDKGRVFGVAYDHDGKAKAGMGVTVADVDDDLDVDVLVCNLRNESDSFYRNEGTYFRDTTAPSRLMTSKPFTRFGMGWIDFDHDGVLDLFQANGKVMDYSDSATADPYAEINLLMRGSRDADHGIRFEEVEPRGGTAERLIHTSRGAAFGDVNGDGLVDVLVLNRDAPAYLLINQGVDLKGQATRVRLLNRHGADAIGAVLEADVDGRRVRREVRPGYSYLTSNEPTLHIGLGSADALANVRIRWTDGSSQEIDRLEPGTVHEIRQR